MNVSTDHAVDQPQHAGRSLRIDRRAIVTVLTAQRQPTHLFSTTLGLTRPALTPAAVNHCAKPS